MEENVKQKVVSEESESGEEVVVMDSYPYFTRVRKRDGRVVSFHPDKVTDAIFNAARAVGGSNRDTAENLTYQVVKYLKDQGYNGLIPGVEDIQDAVEKVLIENGHARTAKAYILYRDRRTRIREGRTELMDTVKEILVETNRENANINNSPSAKMLQIAMAASKKYYLTNMVPDEYAQSHLQGDLHIHDLDYYSKTLNCLQIDLKDLLLKGFNTGHGFIRPPQRIASAAAQAAIILQSNQNDMYGGQSFPHFDYDMGEVVRNLKHRPDYEEVFQSMEGLIYNLNTMHSRAGAQVPFSSINLGTDKSREGRMVTRAVLESFEKGLGRGENPIFPNLVFRVKKGVNLDPGDPNYDLFQLALKAASRRLNPTFSFMDSTLNQPYGEETAYMGCRTRTIGNRHGPEVSAGRGNIAPVTLNLPRLALKSRGDSELFFVELDRLMRLAARQLIHRFEVLSRLKVKDLPFLMGQQLYLDSRHLSEEENIREVIKHGSLSIGYIGLAEAVCSLTGRHHGEDEETAAMAYQIMEHMKRRTDMFAEEFDLNFVLYATPAEGLAGRFVEIDREKYGIIPGITDKEFYTNSYHVPVNYAMSLFEKLTLEGRFHRLNNGGHISYVELESPPQHNIEAVEKIVRHMYQSDVGYGGINYPIDECCNCAHSGVIDDACPVCGSLQVRRIRRITGYLSTEDRFNDSKQAELKKRVPHFFGGRH